MRPRIIRLGLIGAGRWGRNIIATLGSMRDARLAMVASRNPGTAGLCPADCIVTRDWREVTRARGLDAVVIATPPSLHVPIASDAIRSGKAVFIEKPLSLDPRQARYLLTLAGKRRAFVLVDHIDLFNPAYEVLKRAARGLGPARSIVSEGGNHGPFRPDTPPLWDYVPHDLSLCMDLLGSRPSRVSASRERGPRGANWKIRLTFPGGTTADIRAGNEFPERTRRFEACFASAVLIFDDVAKTLARRSLRGDALGPRRNLHFPETPPLRRSLELFAAAIRSDSRSLASLKLGVAVVETLARIERSGVTSRHKTNSSNLSYGGM